MKTTTLPAPAPLWHLVDAKDQTIGFIAAKCSHILRGKHRPSFSPHQLCGDHIVIVNAAQMNVTPAKGRRKTYFHHTGHLGHSSTTTLTKMMEKDPTVVIEKAVYGMLPKNRLRPRMLKRLHVYADDKHKYAPQKPQPLDLSAML